MIPRTEFYAHQAICKSCEFWSGVCLKGHALQSAQGCPLHKFEPIAGAGYAPDRPVQPAPEYPGCCGQKPDMPPLTWPQVLQEFTLTMAQWAVAGFPLADGAQHQARYGQCKLCPDFVNFYCGRCRCVAYVKTKLKTAACPAPSPRWV
jgi:hypothetical protein